MRSRRLSPLEIFMSHVSFPRAASRLVTLHFNLPDVKQISCNNSQSPAMLDAMVFGEGRMGRAPVSRQYLPPSSHQDPGGLFDVFF
jgi:hypothetical protein